MSAVTIAKSAKKNTVSKPAMKKKNTKKTATVETAAPAVVTVTAPVNITGKAITNIALLAKLKVSTWVGNIQDKEMTATACTQNNIDATKRLLSLRKRLMKSDELNAVINMAQKLRQYHSAVTRPWLPGGIGCLPSVSFASVKEQFDTMINDFNRLADDFIASFDTLVSNDRVQLGAAFDITDYPNATELREKFKASVEYMPIPSANDFRVEGLSSAVLTQLQQEMEKNMTERMKQGDAELLQRILEGDQPAANGGNGNGLKQLLYRLTTANANGDVRFKQNSLDNMIEYAKQIRTLNIGDNKDIAKICDTLETVYAVDADTLRENKQLLDDKAQQTKNTIAEIESAMAGLM